MKFATHKLLAILMVGGAIAAGLSACAPMVLGGAVVGTMVATDRRTSGTQLEDEGIELRAASRIRESLGERSRISVTSYNRQVLLSGEIPTEQDRQTAEQLVAKVENVRSIVNELAVLGNATMAQRTTDAYVTTRVKAGMVDARDLFANAFKVVTERGTTYLMGRVTQREADRATEITRATDGVHKVVRLLEIISEEELANTLPKLAPVEDRK